MNNTFLCFVRQGGRQLVRDPLRPSEIVVEVFLPEMSSAKTVDLDVEEKRMTLVSKEPAEYRLVVDFAYPVDEEKGLAKFDRSTKKLFITLPVKSVAVNRLASTDSGIDIDFDDESIVDIVKEDTAYRTSTESDSESDVHDVSNDNNNDNELDVSSVIDADQHLLFPTYTCNVYDELMVLKLDVKNVDEESLTKSNLESSEGSGFSLRFTTIGSGMVPLKYGFDMVFLFREDEPCYSLDDLEVEIWDNNIIVQVTKSLLLFVEMLYPAEKDHFSKQNFFPTILDGSSHGWMRCLQGGQLPGQLEGAYTPSTKGIQTEEKTADGESLLINRYLSYMTRLTY